MGGLGTHDFGGILFIVTFNPYVTGGKFRQYKMMQKN